MKIIYPSIGRSFWQASILMFVSALLCRAALSQVDRATLEGTITDPSGAAIVGARVSALAVATDIAQEARTNANGYYRIPGLAVGRYAATATKLVSRPKSSKT